MASERAKHFYGRVDGAEHRCEADGCALSGEFRAPRSNTGDRAAGWHWFCLEHVRAFNAAYNYFNGMNPDEIAAAQNPHPSWERATQPFATNGTLDDVDDPLGILANRYGRRRFDEAVSRGGKPVSPADRKALTVLRLDSTARFADIRRVYKELVRRYHPDSNGGDRSLEGKLQEVIDAYTHLKSAAAFAA